MPKSLTARIGRLLLVLSLAILAHGALLAGARADPPSPADTATIRGMIETQMHAFAADDGTTAYAYASPTIRRLFPSPEIFLDMVRSGYPPVYRPQSATYGDLVEGPGGALFQTVYLIGPDGQSWIAVYELQKQPDGSWLINGCTLVHDVARTA